VGGATVGSARQVFPAAADQCPVGEADRTTDGNRARVLKSLPCPDTFLAADVGRGVDNSGEGLKSDTVAIVSGHGVGL
jgi:hypothetical protein